MTKATDTKKPAKKTVKSMPAPAKWIARFAGDVEAEDAMLKELDEFFHSAELAAFYPASLMEVIQQIVTDLAEEMSLGEEGCALGWPTMSDARIEFGIFPMRFPDGEADQPAGDVFANLVFNVVPPMCSVTVSVVPVGTETPRIWDYVTSDDLDEGLLGARLSDAIDDLMPDWPEAAQPAAAVQPAAVQPKTFTFEDFRKNLANFLDGIDRSSTIYGGTGHDIIISDMARTICERLLCDAGAPPAAATAALANPVWDYSRERCGEIVFPVIIATRHADDNHTYDVGETLGTLRFTHLPEQRYLTAELLRADQQEVVQSLVCPQARQTRNQEKEIIFLATEMFYEKFPEAKKFRTIYLWADPVARQWYYTIMRLDGTDEHDTRECSRERAAEWLDPESRARKSYVEAGVELRVTWDLPDQKIVTRNLERNKSKPTNADLAKKMREETAKWRSRAKHAPLLSETNALLEMTSLIDRAADSLEALDGGRPRHSMMTSMFVGKGGGW